MRLKAMKRWAEEQETLGKEINIRNFTPEVCKKIQRELSKPPDKRKDQERTSSKEKLAKFSGKAQHWEQSKRALIAHLNQIRNDKGVPLYFIVRDGSLEETYRSQNGKIGAMIYDA